GRGPAAVPRRRVLVPGAAPVTAVPKNHLRISSNHQLVNQRGELVALRRGAAGVAARRPDVAPAERGTFGEIDFHALEGATVRKGDGRPREENGRRAGLDVNLPLLRREAARRRVDARRRLADDDYASPRADHDLRELAVAVEQAGGRVQQVEECGPGGGE